MFFVCVCALTCAPLSRGARERAPGEGSWSVIDFGGVGLHGVDVALAPAFDLAAGREHLVEVVL